MIKIILNYIRKGVKFYSKSIFTVPKLGGISGHSGSRAGVGRQLKIIHNNPEPVSLSLNLVFTRRCRDDVSRTEIKPFNSTPVARSNIRYLKHAVQRLLILSNQSTGPSKQRYITVNHLHIAAYGLQIYKVIQNW